MNLPAVKQVLAALEREGVDYAVFGGAALNLHGLARFTEDLDLFIAANVENVAALRRALHAVYADPTIDEISAEDLLGEYPAVQYVPPEEGFHLDILTRLGDAYRFADLERERIPFEELMVWVVTPGTLYRMKRDTVRPKDRMDAAMLREHFELKDGS